jgi:thioredoxin 1
MSDITTSSDDMLRTVDGGGFNRIVMQGSGRVAVEFMSYGCGYCRAIEPILQRVASAIAADVTILRVNIAAEPELARNYEIGGTPTFVMFLDGIEVGRTEGPDPTEPAVMAAITRPFMS